MTALTLSASDGLALHVQDWNEGSEQAAPLLGLPGIIGTSGDFAALAERYPERRLVSLDYAGRGRSGRAKDARRYHADACLGDVLDLCAALHLHGVVAVGTGFGGTLAMRIAVARPNLLRAAVLNDVGPPLAEAGRAAVRSFAGDDAALPDLDACVARLRACLPDRPRVSDEDWRRLAARSYAPGEDGRWHPLWDTRIAGLLEGRPPDLWPAFGALCGHPVLLLRGEYSTLLTAEGVAEMQRRMPGMAVATIPEAGHAPTLAEPESIDALDGFLARVG